MANASIQFFRGIDEPVVPDIRLTRSRDGRTGQATFIFEQPQALAPETLGDIGGMWMVDEEGEMVTREVNGKFVNGKPSALEATYTWKTNRISSGSCVSPSVMPTPTAWAIPKSRIPNRLRALITTPFDLLPGAVSSGPGRSDVPSLEHPTHPSAPVCSSGSIDCAVQAD